MCIDLPQDSINCADSRVQAGVKGGDEFYIFDLDDVATLPAATAGAITTLPVMKSGKKIIRVFQRDGMLLAPNAQFVGASAGFEHTAEFIIYSNSAAANELATSLSSSALRLAGYYRRDNGDLEAFGMGVESTTVSAIGIGCFDSGAIVKNPKENGGGIKVTAKHKAGNGELSALPLVSVSAATWEAYLTANLAA